MKETSEKAAKTASPRGWNEGALAEIGRTELAEIIGLSREQEALLGQLMEREGLASSTEPAVIPRLALKKAPLSLGQRRLWFLEQLRPNTPLYNLPLAIRLEGRLRIEALEPALQALVARHESLRTILPVENGEAVQTILDPRPIALRVVPAEEPFDRELAQRALEEEARRPFDLARGPLVRFYLQRRSEADHVLLLVLHHIIADAGSLNLLFDELVALYEHFAASQPARLTPLSIQYPDFAAWQRESNRSEKQADQLAYWKRQLTHPPAALNCPSDRPRPVEAGIDGAIQSVTFPRKLAEELRTLCHQEQVTPFMALLSAFQVLLHRHTGQSDLLIGSLMSHRSRIETEPLVGFFVNTVALRANVTGQATFREILSNARETALAAAAHQDVPFERVIEALGLERNHAHHPLFQIVFSFEHDSRRTRRAAGLSFTPLEIHTGVAKFDLALSIAERDQDLRATIEYRTDLFDATTIERLLNRYQTLLQSIVANPGARVSELSYLSQSEREVLLRGLNDTREDYPSDRCVHELFEEQANKTPEAIAAVFDGQEFKYRDLEDRANQIAKTLRELGVGPEVLVGIFMERSLEMLASLLGVLKAGGAYLPLDLRYPKERLDYMLSDAQPAVVLTQQKWLDALPRNTARILCVDGGPAPEDSSRANFPFTQPQSTLPANPPLTPPRRGAGKSGVQPSSPPGRGWGWVQEFNARKRFRENLSPDGGEGAAIELSILEGGVSSTRQRPHPDNLAYVIYTSGSTGRPKGVEVPHRGVVNFLNSVRKRPGLDFKDVLLAVTPISFDIAALELFLPLIVGARVVIAREEVTADGAALAQALVDSAATVMQATPATWRLLRQSGWPGDSKLKALCGGEALPPRLANELSASCGSLWNLYGPTETTIWSSAARIEPGARIVALGSPLDNTRIYALDRYGEPVPFGVPGELCIAGRGVARGYRNRPELTAEKFVPDPFGLDAGARFYRTGDLVRYRADGTLEFMGRLDHQIKIRGHRIELGEVESALLRHPAVNECVVAARQGSAGDSQLVAYLVCKPDQTATAKSVHEFAKRKLPAPMIPAAFVFLARLPRTPNGKMDRAALPAPDATHRARLKRFVAPRTALEKTLAVILADVLGLEQVGVHDNFFEAGGHSLLATQVITRLNAVCRVDLPVRRLFEGPTVADLAREVSRQQTAPFDPGPMIRKRGRHSRAEELLAHMDELSDAEVEALLAKRVKPGSKIQV